MIDFSENPIIAAVRTQQEFVDAVCSPVRILFLLHTSVLTLPEEIRLAKAQGKTVFVHCDLMEGVGRDSAAIGYIAKAGADGIVSTRVQTVRLARDWNLMSVQRFFLVDSHAVDTAIESVKNFTPDMVEIMPGVLPKMIARFCRETQVPIIAGGLIESKAEVIAALRAGASAVSAAQPLLWKEE